MNAVDYITRGYKYFQQGNFDQALLECEKAIKCDPNHAKAYFVIGRVNFSLHQYDQALQSFNKAIQIVPNNYDGHHAKGDTLYRLRQFEQAVEAYNKALQIDPSDYLGNSAIGFALYELHQYDQALQSFNKAIQIDPSEYQAYYGKGYTLYKLRQYDQALQSFNKAIQIDPNNYEGHYGKGDTLYRIRQYDQALQSFNKAIQIDPGKHHVYYGKVNVLYELQKYDHALEICNKVLQIDPNNSNLHYKKGDTLYRLRQYEQALLCSNKAIQIDPNHAEAYIVIGLVNLCLHQYEQALETLNKVLQIEPDNYNAHIAKGKVYDEMKQYDQALKAYNKGLQIEPDNYLAHIAKGKALFFLQQYEQALETLNKALQIEPNKYEAHFEKGLIYQVQNKHEKALESYKISIELNDTFSGSYFNLATIFYHLLDYSSAQANFVRSINLTDRKPFFYTKIINFFEKHGEAPFAIKRLLGDQLAYLYLSSHRSYIEQVENQCQPVQDCLDWAEFQAWNTRYPERFMFFTALCQYFMGDTAEAYHLFDDKIDSDTLSLIGHYYYLSSAIHSAIPEHTIKCLRKDALGAAKAAARDSNTPLIDLYYAGQILYSFGTADDIPLATLCFNKAKSILAAKYMIWFLAPEQERLILRIEIEDQESRILPHKRFSQKLQPRPIGRSFHDFDESMQHYCFYNEINIAIQEFHNFSTPLPVVPFYEYWQFVLSTKSESESEPAERTQLTNYIKEREAEKAFTQIGRLLEAMKAYLSTETLEENIRGSLLSLYERFIFLKNQALAAENMSKNGIEMMLAGHIWESIHVKNNFASLNIRGLGYWEVHQQFILYFYGKGFISVRAAINLIMYAGYVAAEENLFSLIRQTASIDGTSDLLKGVPELEDVKPILSQLQESAKLQEVGKVLAGSVGMVLLPIGGNLASTFFLGFVVKALLSIVEERLLKPKELKPPKVDYQNFLDLLNERVAASQYEGNPDPSIIRILGFQ